jgi:hypothetical protein
MAASKAKVETPNNMDQRFIDGTVVTLEDAEIRYSHMINPDTEYTEEWSVHAKIDPSQVEVMMDLGFNIKEDDANGTYWLKAKRVCRTRAGKDQSPPVLKMEDGTTISFEPGNGSVGDVHLWCKYTNPIKGKIYMGTYLNGFTGKEVKDAALGGGGVTF